MRLCSQVRLSLALQVVAILSLTGCAYRMAAPLVQSSPERLRVVASAPENYYVLIRSKPHQLGPDGRITFDLQMIHRGCSVYLFDRIPIRRVPAPTKEKVVFVMIGKRTLAKLSVRDLSKLPLDSGGFRLLTLRAK